MRARSLNFPEGKEPLERGSDFGAVSLSRFCLVQTSSALLVACFAASVSPSAALQGRVWDWHCRTAVGVAL